MKDVQEIMKKMNESANEVAITIQQIPNIPLLACSCDTACNGGVGGLTDCAAQDLIVEAFPCIVTAPRNFTFNNATENSRLAYSLADLRVSVEPCNCTAGTTVYAVRIVGSIPYTVNVPLAITDGNCYFEFNGTEPFAITAPVYGCCCCGNAPVDNILGYTCSLEQAAFARGIIAAALGCEFVTPGLTVVFDNAAEPATATVTATFTFENLCSAATQLSKK